MSLKKLTKIQLGLIHIVWNQGGGRNEQVLKEEVDGKRDGVKLKSEIFFYLKFHIDDFPEEYIK